MDVSGNKGAFVSLVQHVSLFYFILDVIQIRIDSAGNREYTQFDAVPHPPMKPMAYVQGGLSSMLMM